MGPRQRPEDVVELDVAMGQSLVVEVFDRAGDARSNKIGSDEISDGSPKYIEYIGEGDGGKSFEQSATRHSGLFACFKE